MVIGIISQLYTCSVEVFKHWAILYATILKLTDRFAIPKSPTTIIAVIKMSKKKKAMTKLINLPAVHPLFEFLCISNSVSILQNHSDNGHIYMHKD